VSVSTPTLPSLPGLPARTPESSVPRPIGWLLRGWAKAEDAEPWEQTSWERGKSDTAAWAQDRPISFSLLPVAVGGGVAVIATVITSDLAVWVQILSGITGAVVGYCAGVLLIAVALALRAPTRQRNELRAVLSERHAISALIDVDRHLRQLRDSNRVNLESVLGVHGREGALGEDQDPWVRGLNEGLELTLETYGFPELVPQLVLRNPPLSTWEDVRRAARQIDANLTAVLEGQFFADVRHLREVVAAEAAEGSKGLPSERLSMLRMEGESLREAAGTRGYGDEIMEAAAHSNEVAKWTTEVEACLRNIAPDLLPEWHERVGQWDSNISGSDRFDERLELLDGFVARLRAKEQG
jgi:hypothetical protein